MYVRAFLTIALCVTLAKSASGQRHKFEINTETPEGKELQAIGTENDAAAKLALMEKFLAAHPKHAGAAWVAEQAVAAHLKAGNLAKASAAGDLLLAADPDDLESALAILKGHEQSKEAAGAIRWSNKTSEIARKSLSAPKPADAEEAKNWQAARDYATQVEQYAEYALLNQIARGASPDEAAALVAALEARNPKSQYLGQAAGAAVAALRRANENDKAVAIAERALARDGSNEELLLLAADHYMKQNDSAKTLQYATKLVEVMSSREKPQQMSDTDWAARRNTLLGAGNWMAGVTQATTDRLADADRSLRAALPLLTDDGMKAAALFHLGVANFKLGESANDVKRVQEGFRFSQQCAAMNSPYKANAAKNVTAIQQKYKFPATPGAAKPAPRKK